MAIPTIITQLINIVYNFADAWYVGRTGNASMMAALSSYRRRRKLNSRRTSK